MQTDEQPIAALLEDLYEEVKGVRRDLRRADRLREDLGLDSLAAAELFTAAEEELGLDLADDERLPRARTVGDVLELLSTPARGAAAGVRPSR